MALRIQVDKVNCTGCRICEMVCTLHHEGVVNPEKARIIVTEHFDESIYQPHICQQCDVPDCVNACPMGALSQEDGSGLISVEQDLCNGCLACVEACTYGAIKYVAEFDKIYVCDQCDGDPTCVKFCTSQALRQVEAGVLV